MVRRKVFYLCNGDLSPTTLDESYRSAFYRLTRCAHPGSPCPSLLAGDLVVLRGNHLPLAIALWPGVGPDLALLLVGMRLVFPGSHSSEGCALRNRPVRNTYCSVEIESNAKLILAWHLGVAAHTMRGSLRRNCACHAFCRQNNSHGFRACIFHELRS